MIYTGNYAWFDWSKGGFARDGDVFEECNLCQQEPGTPIGLKPDGVPAKGLLFRRCNLVNCKLPDQETWDYAASHGCNIAQITKEMRAARDLEDAKARSAVLGTRIVDTQGQKTILDAEIAVAIAKGVK